MKKVLVLLVVGMIFLNGCAYLEQGCSEMKSEMVKLDRTITLYANDGSVMRVWDGKIFVDADGSDIRFMYNGKAVRISGTYIIEEK